MRGPLDIDAADLDPVHRGERDCCEMAAFRLEASNECVTESQLEAVSSFSVGEVLNVVFQAGGWLRGGNHREAPVHPFPEDLRSDHGVSRQAGLRTRGADLARQGPSRYGEIFIGHWPADTTVQRVARTVGPDQVVDELVMSFTHDIVTGALLPGVPPTGRPVRLAVCVVGGFRDGKLDHEHIY